ncbi:hypothetical protein [Jilunia laotingensis]|uniref:hypothetical protein n=1 Tax=Jilunia laotingensis TaxID=2763675 RepID=UPI00223B3C82|nr:hypothetical protein [Jilunia laotingensis]
MILCIFGAAKSRLRRGVQRGLPLALLGNFQRYGVLRLGKFPNKLRYFLRKYPAACRWSFCGGSPCRLLTRITPPYYFPLSVGGGRRGGRFRFQRLLCTGRSDARFRGRILPEDGVSITEYSYDSNGRLVSATNIEQYDGSTHTSTYTVTWGTNKIIESRNGEAITYTLENGLITHTSDSDGGDLDNTDFTYNANNQLVKLQYDEEDYLSYTW